MSSPELQFDIDPSELARLLLGWFDAHKRELPWRSDPQPYKVWLSEVMLQQTQVATVVPYFNRFLARYPTLEDLAEAPEEEVLSLWSGLGYYNRARNLHLAAGEIRENFSGRFPNRFEDMIRLPGIGRYTAGAILSIAFGQPYPVLDGNIKRVFARLLEITCAFDSQATAQLWELLTRLVQFPEIAGRISDFNQALMELGALICTPRNPSCDACPLSVHCRARSSGSAEQLPVKQTRVRQEEFHFTCAVIETPEGFLMLQNNEGPYLKGFWEFPKIPCQFEAESFASAFRKHHTLQITPLQPLGTVRHQITFRRLFFHAVRARLHGTAPNRTFRWVMPGEPGIPFSAYIDKILKLL